MCFRFLLIYNGPSRADLPLLLVAGISVSITVSCREDAGQDGDEVEELVDKPSTTIGTQFDVSQ